MCWTDAGGSARGMMEGSTAVAPPYYLRMAVGGWRLTTVWNAYGWVARVVGSASSSENAATTL